MKRLTAQIIIDIIREEMTIPSNQIWIRNQSTKIPNDNNLYIIVGVISSIPQSNNVYMATVQDMQIQINQSNIKEMVQIDVVSHANVALTAYNDVIMALNSYYSQQQQELNNFRIYPLGINVADTGSAEGASMLNRYSITVPVMAWYRKEKLLNSPLGDYYDDFTARVDDDNSIGTDKPIAEFEINSGGIVP